MRMQMEGYDPAPAKRVIAELHALKDQMNFKDKVEHPNICLLILISILIIPAFLVMHYLLSKQAAFMEQLNDFRTQSVWFQFRVMTLGFPMNGLIII